MIRQPKGLSLLVMKNQAKSNRNQNKTTPNKTNPISQNSIRLVTNNKGHGVHGGDEIL